MRFVSFFFAEDFGALLKTPGRLQNTFETAGNDQNTIHTTILNQGEEIIVKNLNLS